MIASARWKSWLTNWRESGASRRRELRRATHAFTRSKLSVVGLAIFVFVLFVALFAPYIAPYPEDAGATTHMSERLQPPSPAHWFGTDEFGRDIFSRVVIASRLDLGLALSVMGATLVIGVALGAWAGIVGGMVDEIIMRSADLFMTIPDFILALAIITAIGPGLMAQAAASILGTCGGWRCEVRWRHCSCPRSADRCYARGAPRRGGEMQHDG